LRVVGINVVVVSSSSSSGADTTGLLWPRTSIIVPAAVTGAPGVIPGNRRTWAIASAIALRSAKRSSGCLPSARRMRPSTPTGTPASGATSMSRGGGSPMILRAIS
jgi:hypothetical protein